ncbi:uncharacterized protein LAESUDRAFT_53649 [Laetiporus sulphureus 93-53]|uniref:Wax synthase domain-containing protein n=1 Tax=Laetiporus sulphureus 93-53 TaxID=1314785 RepID=A0A165FCI7_9APHY|nr:uncharacterized protein LAESUDRAFT_53649 [Laetiporus sulphureus 93-53]KZT08762.1 hypothetical protein LAESUDRAFT_53649 [Laetiporus sulphureus 93-53]
MLTLSGLSTLYDVLLRGVYRTYRELVTPYEHRDVLTWKTAPIALFFFVPSLALAFYARRHDTRMICLLILPLSLMCTVICTYRFKIEDSRFLALEFFRTLIAYYIIAKSLYFAFAPKQRWLKVEEKQLRRVHEPPLRADKQAYTNRQLLPTWLCDALELFLSVRGIGWDFGRGVYVPPSTRSSARGAFLIQTALSFLKHFLIFDLCDALLKLVPGVGTPEGGTIFLQHLPPAQRYAVSTAIQLLAGTLIICSLESGNDLISLFAVGLFESEPAAWPPLYDSPWWATSLRDLWGRRWHQLLRHTFLIIGGYPGGWLFGRPGAVLGTFLASGVYHELSLGIAEPRVTLFFVLNGVGILLEEVWERWTGRKMGGFVGWLWTAFWVIGVGQMCVDAWARSGLAGAIIVPPQLSLVRRMLFPAIQSYTLSALP